jgi:methionyl-tRNA formyltransferase
MKILLLADQKVGLEILRFLLECYRHDLALVVTIAENEIYHEARERKVPVHVFGTNEELMARLKEPQTDLGVLAWWPNIIKSLLLEMPRLGFINTHPSLLPHNRGKHYNFWAIVEEAPFGVSLHFVDARVDAGDIVAQQRIEYDWCETGGSLYHKAQEAMVSLFRATYPSLREGRFQRCPQDLNRGSFHKASELEAACHIDLDSTYRGRKILNLLRAKTFPGYPGCWFEEDGNRYEIRVDIRKIEE